MIRLFAMVLMAPFWVHFLLAGGVVGAGYLLYDAETKGYAEKVRLAQSAPPELMSIVDFHSDAPRSFPVEVNLRAQIAIRHNVNLVKTKNGRTVGERSLYILVAPDAPSDTKVAYGAVILHPFEVSKFIEWAERQDKVGGPMGPVLTFDGLRDHPYDTSHILSALNDQGFIAAKDFTYVAPFLSGREAGLAIKAGDAPVDLKLDYYIAAFFVFLGVLKIGLRLRPKGRAVAEAGPAAGAAAKPRSAQAIAQTEGVVVQSSQSLPSELPALASNDFIGALSRKAAAASGSAGVAAGVAAKTPWSASAPAFGQATRLRPAVASGGGMLARITTAIRLKLRNAVGLAGALILYLMFSSFGGSFGMPSNVLSMGGAGTTPVVTEVTMTEFAPIPTPVAVSTAPAADAAQQPQTVAEVQKPNAAEALPVTARQVSMIDRVKVQIAQLLAAPPMWLLATLMGTILALIGAMILPKTGMMRSRRAAKGAVIDPFERLLQRRLAEKARAETVTMAGSGLHRA